MSVDDVRVIAEAKEAIAKALVQIAEILQQLQSEHGWKAVAEACRALEEVQ